MFLDNIGASFTMFAAERHSQLLCHSLAFTLSIWLIYGMARASVRLPVEQEGVKWEPLMLALSGIVGKVHEASTHTAV